MRVWNEVNVQYTTEPCYPERSSSILDIEKVCFIVIFKGLKLTHMRHRPSFFPSEHRVLTKGTVLLLDFTFLEQNFLLFLNFLFQLRWSPARPTRLGAAPGTNSMRYIKRPAGGLPAGSSLLLSSSLSSGLDSFHFCWPSGIS